VQARFGSQRGDDAGLEVGGRVLTASEQGSMFIAVTGGRRGLSRWLRGQACCDFWFMVRVISVMGMGKPNLSRMWQLVQAGR